MEAPVDQQTDAAEVVANVNDPERQQ